MSGIVHYPLSLPVSGLFLLPSGGEKCSAPAAGTGCPLPADLAILRCCSMSPSRRSQLPLTRGERGTSSAIFTLLKEKIKVRQIEITWENSEGSQHTALFKTAGTLGKSSKVSRQRPASWGLHFPRGFATPGSVSQTLGGAFWAMLPVLSQWERGGKRPEDLLLVRSLIPSQGVYLH